MRAHRIKAGIFVFLFAVFFAFSGGAAPARTGEPAPQGADKSQVVVAEVNGRKITMAEVEERLALMPPAVRIQVRKNREQFLEGLVQAELLYQEALHRKFDALPEVDKRVDRAKRRIVVDEFVRREVNKESEVSEKDLRDFFAANRERFRRKESVTLSHIVVKTEKEAWEAAAELRRGIPFAQVARDRSIFEATRDAGGVMGTAARGELDKKLEEVAFKLAIGQASDPIETRIGWQIIRVTERIPAAEARLEDVKEDVKQIFLELKGREAYEKLIGDLKKRGSVAIYPERFQ